MLFRCSSPIEDCLHCLRDCPHSKELWLKLGACAWHNFQTLDVQVWVRSHARGVHGLRFLACLWGAWKWRNHMVFEDHPWSIHEAWRRICQDHDEFLRFMSNIVSDVGDNLMGNVWVPPKPGFIKLNVDGSFRDWAKCIGGGGVLRDEKGNCLMGFKSMEVGGNSFLAEVLALKEGLLLAWSNGFLDVICEMDCAEVLSGLEDPQSLQFCPSLNDIKVLLNRQWRVSLHLVHRDKNHAADSLAKLGVAASDVGVQILRLPPPEDLVGEMGSVFVRIALQSKKKNDNDVPLLEERAWMTYCNGMSMCEVAMKVDCGDKESRVLKAVDHISVGAGVLPSSREGDWKKRWCT
ncbi:hypothetical protein OROGR_009365 [Orobanche gracilis]